MSDPAKSSEIEDVLASIRKLVSVDPTGGLKTPRGTTTQKLVLTSDQRVGDGDGRPDRGNTIPAAPLRLEASASSEHADLARDQQDPTEDEAVSGALHIVTDGRDTDQDASPVGAAANSDEDPNLRGGSDEASEPGCESGADDVVEKAGEGDELPPILHGESFEFKASNTTQDAPDDPVEADDTRETDDAVRPGSTLEARIAELEAAVSSQTSDFEPDGSEDLQQHRPERVPSRRPAPSADTEDAIAQLVSDAAHSVVTHELEEAVAKTSSGAADAEPDQPSRGRIFSRVQSAADNPSLEAVEGDSVAEPDPAEGSAVDEVGERGVDAIEPEHGDLAFVTDDTETTAIDTYAAVESADAEEIRRGSDTAVHPDPQGKEPELDGEVSEEGAILDEAALRDLVSEIVRSELQGALGERITRNVRKLVRREIMRAITVRDLE